MAWHRRCCNDSYRLDRHCKNQRRCEARQRAGVGLFPVPMTSRDIDVLINLRYLREGAQGNRARVGEAVAAVIRELGRPIEAIWQPSLALPPTPHGSVKRNAPKTSWRLRNSSVSMTSDMIPVGDQAMPALTVRILRSSNLEPGMSVEGQKRKFSPRAHCVRFTPECGHQSGHALRSALYHFRTHARSKIPHRAVIVTR